MKKISSLALVLASIFCLQAQAQEVGEGSKYDEAKEAEVAVKAKKRLYPGGRDEEDLKVQSQLTTPVRKFAPQTELKAEPEADE